MRILIRGAGDLATGIASRLYRAGHSILMTEISVPLTVRRTVAFSRAVYEGKARVEDMEAFLAGSEAQAREILGRGDIAVMIDPEAGSREWFQPDVIVDAILAKKNLGTRITDAPFVIGVGPGFTAGKDCGCVVETKRGHTLGNIIWKGSAIPNTGIPGNVGGYTTERLIRAAADGTIEPRVKIGECVEKDQIVAVTGGKPVYAQMSGIVRGMLQEGIKVTKDLKIGDIDARAEISHCFTISDKARAIGGGVLEAVEHFGRMKGRYAVVMLAAGAGTRFGGDKLKTEVNGRTLYETMLEKARVFSLFPSYIVTGDEEIAKAAEKYGTAVVWNKEPEKGISRSVRAGLEAVISEHGEEVRGVLFTVCDQPWIEISTLQRIFSAAAMHPGSIVCAGYKGKRANPVLWDRKYFSELSRLSGDEGGRQIMEQHREWIRVVEAEEKELADIDRREDIRKEEGL